MAVAGAPSQQQTSMSLQNLVRTLVCGLIQGAETVDEVNASNRERFADVCRQLEVSSADALVDLCRPPEVSMDACRVDAAVRLTSTKSREFDLSLRLGGRLVDSFFQKRFAIETIQYQHITVELAKVGSLEGLFVTDPNQRDTVREILESYVRRNRESTRDRIRSRVERADRFLAGFANLRILASVAGWICLFSTEGRTRPEPLYVSRSGDLRMTVPKGAQVLPLSTPLLQRFGNALVAPYRR